MFARSSMLYAIAKLQPKKTECDRDRTRPLLLLLYQWFDGRDNTPCVCVCVSMNITVYIAVVVVVVAAVVIVVGGGDGVAIVDVCGAVKDIGKHIKCRHISYSVA